MIRDREWLKDRIVEHVSIPVGVRLIDNVTDAILADVDAYVQNIARNRIEIARADRGVCDFHGTFNVECGGPHRVVHTNLGDEVLAPSEQPKGTPEEDV